MLSLSLALVFAQKSLCGVAFGQNFGGRSLTSAGAHHHESEIHLSADLRIYSALPEFREAVSEAPLPGLGSAPGAAPARAGQVHLTQADFALEVPFRLNAQHSMSAALNVNLRGLHAVDTTIPGGTEIGSYGLGLVGHSMGLLSYRLSVAEQRSERLRLYDRHPEVWGGIYLSTHQHAAIVHLSSEIGPEGAWAFGGRDPAGIEYKYGPQFGARARLGVDADGGPATHFRTGFEALFRRVMSYEIAGQAQGGAGLMALVASLDYKILPSLWFGFQFEHAVFRPAGRENVFGTTQLPGLFGNAFGLHLVASAPGL